MTGWPAQNFDYLVFLALVLTSWVGLRRWLQRRKIHEGMPRTILLLAATVLLGGWFVVDQAGREARTGTRQKFELLLPLYAREFERLGHAQVPTDSPFELPVYL